MDDSKKFLIWLRIIGLFVVCINVYLIDVTTMQPGSSGYMAGLPLLSLYFIIPIILILCIDLFIKARKFLKYKNYKYKVIVILTGVSYILISINKSLNEFYNIKSTIINTYSPQIAHANYQGLTVFTQGVYFNLSNLGALVAIVLVLSSIFSLKKNSKNIILL